MKKIFIILVFAISCALLVACSGDDTETSVTTTTEDSVSTTTTTEDSISTTTTTEDSISTTITTEDSVSTTTTTEDSVSTTTTTEDGVITSGVDDVDELLLSTNRIQNANFNIDFDAVFADNNIEVDVNNLLVYPRNLSNIRLLSDNYIIDDDDYIAHPYWTEQFYNKALFETPREDGDFYVFDTYLNSYSNNSLNNIYETAGLTTAKARTRAYDAIDNITVMNKWVRDGYIKYMMKYDSANDVVDVYYIQTLNDVNTILYEKVSLYYNKYGEEVIEYWDNEYVTDESGSRKVYSYYNSVGARDYNNYSRVEYSDPDNPENQQLYVGVNLDRSTNNYVFYAGSEKARISGDYGWYSSNPELVFNEESGDLEMYENQLGEIYSPDGLSSVIKATYNSFEYNIDLYLPSMDGVLGILIDKQCLDVTNIDPDYVTDWLEEQGMTPLPDVYLSTNENNIYRVNGFETVNGKFLLTDGEWDNSITLTGVDLQVGNEAYYEYHNYYSYLGILHFSIQENDLQSALYELSKYLDYSGLVYKYGDIDDLFAESIEYLNNRPENLTTVINENDIFSFQNHPYESNEAYLKNINDINSYININEEFTILQSNYNIIEYDEMPSQNDIDNLTFCNIGDSSTGSAILTANGIDTSNISYNFDRSPVLQEDESYSVIYALGVNDYQSVIGQETPIVYHNEAMNFSGESTFDLESVDISGNFECIMFLAKITNEGFVRISNMVQVPFENTTDTLVLKHLDQESGETISYVYTVVDGVLQCQISCSLDLYTLTYGIINSEYNNTLSIPLNIGEKITQVSLGGTFSIILTSYGRVFDWGHNGYGQLGDGTTVDKYSQIEITSQFNLQEDEMIINISAGTDYSAALTSFGRVFTWGNNEYGKLGDGTNTNRHTPTDITSNFDLSSEDKVISILLGDKNSSALTSKGKLFVWGCNGYGRLGDGTTVNRYIPVDITSNFNLSTGETIIQNSLGNYHSAAITSAGRMFTWGYNDFGRLGDGTTTESYNPIDIGSSFILNDGEKFVQASLGLVNTSVLTNEGRVFSWGNNEYGKLGDGTNSDRYNPVDISSRFMLHDGETITEINLGETNSSAITSEGRLFVWGCNGYGRLGDGTTINRFNPTDINLHFNMQNGDIIVKNSLGNYHSSAITLEGRIFTWGYNDFGRLGDGTTDISYNPKEIQIYYPETINVDVYSFQADINEYVSEVYGNSIDGWYIDMDLTIPYTLTAMPSKDLILYGEYTLNEYTITYNLFGGENGINPSAYTINNSVIFNQPIKNGYSFKGWYNNSEYIGEIISEIVEGSSGDIELYAKWEINQYTIKYGDTSEVYNHPYPIQLNPEETIISVNLGRYSSSAITSDGRLFVWGSNTYYNLGDGSKIDRFEPVDITSKFYLHNNEKIVYSESGYYNSAAITSEGRVFAWGVNFQYTLSNHWEVYYPKDITSYFNLEDGEIITQISIGFRLFGAITSKGRVLTWGDVNHTGSIFSVRYSQIDITSEFNLNEEETIVKISNIGYYFTALTSEGRIFVWGKNRYGVFGENTTEYELSPIDITSQFDLNAEEKIIGVFPGLYFCMALTDSGRVFTWGLNSYGQLGIGRLDEDNYYTPIDITLNFELQENETIINMASGSSHALALSSSGRVFTWGFNDYRQLGYAGSYDESSFWSPREVNSYLPILEGETISSLESGGFHSLAITSEGRILIWGQERYGQLGFGDCSIDEPFGLGFFTPHCLNKVDYDFNSNIQDYIPTKDGYIFDGWYEDYNLTIKFSLTSMPAEDLNLYAKWIPVS
ncbi:InlB B-repeat-containing protein [Mycoplasmatota bacterium WC30]